MNTDYLIIGQGLAGSALAMALRELGASVIVVDMESPHCASRVAAGLVSTVAGKGMNLSWRQAEYLPRARQYYADLEQKAGVKLFHPHNLLRLFTDAKQRAKFENKQTQLAGWVMPANEEDLAQWRAEHGGFIMKHAGWLDTNAYLDTVKKLLGDNYRCDKFSEKDVLLNNSGIVWKDVCAKMLILCQGAFGLTTAEGRRFFPSIPHRCAKGEILKIHLPGKPQEMIINRDGWMIPLGNEQWRVGATYEWDELNGQCSEKGRHIVENKVSGITDARFTVTEHTAAVRPIIRKSQPCIGLHPEHPQVGFFNGLGSKGVITAPSVAQHFASHLINDTPLDPELDLANLFVK